MKAEKKTAAYIMNDSNNRPTKRFVSNAGCNEVHDSVEGLTLNEQSQCVQKKSSPNPCIYAYNPT